MVFSVTNRAWASSRLVCPATASRHTRHSAAVSAVGPVSSVRARRPGPACSSAMARSARARAPHSPAQLDGPAQGVAAFRPAVRAAQLGPQVSERVRQLEPRGTALQHGHGLEEQGLPLGPARHQARGVQRHAQCTRDADPPGERELLAGELAGQVALAEHGQRRSSMDPPVARPR